MRDGWIKKEHWNTEAYVLADDQRKEEAFVSVYKDRQDCFYKVERGLASLSGIKDSLEQAIDEAERLTDMPIDKFNELAIAALEEELASLERKILNISPTTDILRGYHAGYDAGVKATKQQIINALQ